MDPLVLSRWQFAITTIYHFFFVPLTLGLSTLIALMETKYVASGDETYKRMVKFWGKIFLINFAAGTVTGIVQEFHFGMNWSGYARFMGDIFGAPIAIEGLTSFFLESTFLGVWIFGWDRLSKKGHVVAIWLVALGSNISALWILIANSFMQHPVGFAIENGRAVMTDFGALITNANVLYQFPHVLAAGVTTAGFIVLGFSAYQLLTKQADLEIFRRSFRWASIYALIGVVAVGLIGHAHGQWLGKYQPMKTSATEAHWETQAGADFVVIALIDEENQSNPIAFRVPKFLSFLLYNNFTGEVKGIKDLQKEAEEKYGPGNYIPNVSLTFWSFRIMVGVGFLMVGLAFLAFVYRNSFEKKVWLMKMFFPAMALPYIATTSGWIITEESRQPWIVYGLQKTADAVSPTLSTGTVLFSLVIFILIIGALTAITGFLIRKYGTSEPGKEQQAY
jgi:cytochrome d ubiquinol oxidase subunit I